MLGIVYQNGRAVYDLGGRRVLTERELSTKILPPIGWVPPTIVNGLVLVDTVAPNGDPVTATVDENGDVIAVSKRQNLAPLALAAAAAFFFLM